MREHEYLTLNLFHSHTKPDTRSQIYRGHMSLLSLRYNVCAQTLSCALANLYELFL